MKNKRGAIVRLVIWSAVALLLIALLLALAFGSGTGWLNGWTEREGDITMIRTKTWTAEEIRSLEVKWRSGNVTVRAVDGDTATAKETSRYAHFKPMQCAAADGRLTLAQTYQVGFIFFGFGQRASDLELQLPRKQYEEFLLQMTSGHTTIQNVAADTVALRLTSGRMELTGVSAETLEVKVTSGTITGSGLTVSTLKTASTSGQLTLAGAFDAIQGDTTSGNVRLTSSKTLQGLDVHLTSGQFAVTMPDNDGFTLSCKKTSGSLQSTFDLMQPLNSKDGVYRYRDGGTAGRAYSVKITSGTFSLQREAE